MLFRCRKCGNCCRSVQVPITYSDIKRWKREQRWDILAEVRWMVDEKRNLELPVFIRSAINNVCPFLSRSNRCKIYETRPRVCRDFPVLGREDKVNSCKAVSAGAYFDQNTLQEISQRQFADLMDIQRFRRKITATMLIAPILKFQLDSGLVEFDESIGKYRFTDKGIQFMQNQKREIMKKANKMGKTITQLAQENLNDLLRPRRLDDCRNKKRRQRTRRT